MAVIAFDVSPYQALRYGIWGRDLINFLKPTIELAHANPGVEIKSPILEFTEKGISQTTRTAGDSLVWLSCRVYTENTFSTITLHTRDNLFEEMVEIAFHDWEWREFSRSTRHQPESYKPWDDLLDEIWNSLDKIQFGVVERSGVLDFRVQSFTTGSLVGSNRGMSGTSYEEKGNFTDYPIYSFTRDPLGNQEVLGYLSSHRIDGEDYLFVRCAGGGTTSWIKKSDPEHRYWLEHSLKQFQSTKHHLSKRPPSAVFVEDAAVKLRRSNLDTLMDLWERFKHNRKRKKGEPNVQ